MRPWDCSARTSSRLQAAPGRVTLAPGESRALLWSHELVHVTLDTLGLSPGESQALLWPCELVHVTLGALGLLPDESQALL